LSKESAKKVKIGNNLSIHSQIRNIVTASSIWNLLIETKCPSVKWFLSTGHLIKPQSREEYFMPLPNKASKNILILTLKISPYALKAMYFFTKFLAHLKRTHQGNWPLILKLNQLTFSIIKTVSCWFIIFHFLKKFILMWRKSFEKKV